MHRLWWKLVILPRYVTPSFLLNLSHWASADSLSSRREKMQAVMLLLQRNICMSNFRRRIQQLAFYFIILQINKIFPIYFLNSLHALQIWIKACKILQLMHKIQCEMFKQIQHSGGSFSSTLAAAHKQNCINLPEQKNSESQEFPQAPLCT